MNVADRVLEKQQCTTEMVEQTYQEDRPACRIARKSFCLDPANHCASRGDQHIATIEHQ